LTIGIAVAKTREKLLAHHQRACISQPNHVVRYHMVWLTDTRYAIGVELLMFFLM
jgi:hypothetical protein